MIRDFGQDRRGNVAAAFALATLPLLAFSGAAIDYSRASNVRTQMQMAIDAAVLAMAKEPSYLSQEEFEAKGRAAFDANFKAGDVATLTSFAISRTDKTVRLEAAAKVKTTVLSAASITDVPIGASADAMRGFKKIEVVLALDNTGSMSSSNKMTALKTAATDLVNTLEAVAKDEGQVKIGIVPFATTVRLPNTATYRAASWIDFGTSGKSEACGVNGSSDKDKNLDYTKCSVNKTTWEGCVQDRRQPYDAGDTSVNPAIRGTLYPAITYCPSSEKKLAYVQPLTTDFAALRTAINGMTPAGNTNVTIGVAWGEALLSQQAPFADGMPFGDKDTQKYLIVLTDGDNTENRETTETCTSSWFGTTCSQKSTDIDLRTAAACASVKEPTKHITVYTVRVINGNSTLLRNCASDSTKFFDVKNASELGPVFRDIARQISLIRLTT